MVEKSISDFAREKKEKKGKFIVCIYVWSGSIHSTNMEWQLQIQIYRPIKFYD
jgi:hypothetical protein